jgi:AcrR family transcriptional regulator
MKRESSVSQAALLEAASTLLAEEGAEALSVRRIAAAAGCSTMVVYSRFGGKQGVVEALYVEGFERLARTMKSVRVSDDPVADLRRCAQRYRNFALENPTYYSVMFERSVPDFEPSEAARTGALATLGILAERAQQGIDQGRFPPQDALHLATCLWAANHGVVSLELRHVSDPVFEWGKRHLQVIDAMLAGLAEPRPKARA